MDQVLAVACSDSSSTMAIMFFIAVFIIYYTQFGHPNSLLGFQEFAEF